VAFYAKYFDWSGDVAWGDRFITVPLHLMCMVGISLAAEGWVALSFPSRLAVAAICIIALTVQLASVVFLPALETEQEQTYGHRSFVIGQRFENIAGLLRVSCRSRRTNIRIGTPQNRRWRRLRRAICGPDVYHDEPCS
jgi:hypothetical protein